MLHKSQFDNHKWFNVLGAIFLVEGPQKEMESIVSNVISIPMLITLQLSNSRLRGESNPNHPHHTPTPPPTCTSTSCSSFVIVDIMILSIIHTITSYAIITHALTFHAICVIHPRVAHHPFPPPRGLIMATPLPHQASLNTYSLF